MGLPGVVTIGRRRIARPLHQLLAFAYIDLLQWKPAEIVAQLSAVSLEDLGNRFVVDYSSFFPHHRNVVLDLLRPLTERLRGERASLADFFSNPDDAKHCSAQLSHWRSSVYRRIRSDLLYLHALEAALTSQRPRHEQIVCGLVDLLCWTPRTLAEHHCHESLKSLAERLEEGCSAQRPRLGSVLRRIFRPLHRDPALTSRSLCDVLPEGRSPEEVFVLWSTPDKGKKP